MKSTIACLAVSSLFIVGLSHAQAADPSSKDKTFVMKAAQGGMAEVAAGKDAQDKATSQDVKDFGAMMVKDHTSNDDELMSIAKMKNIELPSDTDEMHKSMMAKMDAKSGADFDKAYIKDQITGHKMMLKLMKSEESSKDPELKDFATKTASVVQMHLDKAMELQKGMMK